MLRGINCHSAFKHYEMFHNCHCGGNNYGSIFNTNINISGHGGTNFWGGFGYGLGNAFGGMFSGLFGGGMGMFGGGMNNFGFPSFGMNMFGGFPFMNGLQGLWGGNGNNKTSDSSSTTKTETKEVIKDDPDCKKFPEIITAIDDLGDNPTAEDIKKVQEKIDEARKNLDDNNKTEQGKSLDALEKLLKSKSETPTTPAATAPGASTTPTTPGATTPTTPAATTPTTPADTTPTTPAAPATTSEQIANAATLSGLPDYNTLTTEADRNAYLNKLKDLTANANPEELRALLNKLPEDARIKYKESVYDANLENVKDADISKALISKLVDVIDKSKNTKDIKNFTININECQKINNKWQIVITTKDNQKVTYKQVETTDNEILFHGNNSNQLYVLQKDKTNGHVHLIQYRHHAGYGTKDID